MEIDIFDPQDYCDDNDNNDDDICEERNDTTSYNRQIENSDNDKKKNHNTIYNNEEDSRNNKRLNDDSLRQRMSGLAANKAGLQGINKEKVSQVIYEASKGTPFFENEAKKDEALSYKIDEMLKKYSTLLKKDLSIDLVRIDNMMEILTSERDLSRIIVHIDMDAFYASVEERDNPNLKGKPMAVGDNSMLSTANYEARKYGVRSAMPGFIARKLCSHLILVPLHFDKYRAVSKSVREIFARYDPNFTPMSLDEAYLDITEYLQNISQTTSNDNDKLAKSADEVVQQIRDEIFNETQLTASAGIAANKLLAKVCSDINKPNGQYRIPNDKEIILEFMRNLSIRKVSGIGRVTERILNAIDIKTMGDLFQQRVYVYKMFTLSSFQFLMRASLGIGSTVVKTEYNRKSMSVERTFAPLSKPNELLAKLRELADHLASDLKKEDLSGKTISLKFKSVTFNVTSRAKTFSKYIHSADDLFSYGKQILDAELPLNLRLMGLRLSSLRTHEDDMKYGVKRFFSAQNENSKKQQCIRSSSIVNDNNNNNDNSNNNNIIINNDDDDNNNKNNSDQDEESIEYNNKQEEELEEKDNKQEEEEKDNRQEEEKKDNRQEIQEKDNRQEIHEKENKQEIHEKENKQEIQEMEIDNKQKIHEMEIENNSKKENNNGNSENDPDIEHINVNWECPLCQKDFNNPTILRVNTHIDYCLKTKKVNNNNKNRNKFTSKVKNLKRKRSESSLLKYFEKDNNFIKQHKKIILEKQNSQEQDRDREENVKEKIVKEDDIMKVEIVKVEN